MKSLKPTTKASDKECPFDTVKTQEFLRGFLKKLHSILSKSLESGIIGWNSDGDSFVIYDWSRLVKEVLAKNQVDKAANSFIR